MAIEPKFHQLRVADGTWEALVTDWTNQCNNFNEDFGTYGESTIPVLAELAGNDEPKAGVYALKDGQTHIAICQANTTPLPGYDGPVLRIRLTTLCPNYDFGELSIEEYGMALVTLFVATLSLSDKGKMAADHLKFHLRSAADKTFFSAFATVLDNSPHLRSVNTKGMWLYITK